MDRLPVDVLVPEIVELLRTRRAIVVEAPPGAGKTTRVPRALLDAGFARDGEIVVLEPRRIAARLAARRVAEELGESVGATIGYQVRFEDASSPDTRIRYVTEGILERRLLSSPRLDGVSVVVLDEFHERHLQGDVVLALVERLRRTSRPDLGVVVMSATLATDLVAAHLSAPILRSTGRLFDVAVDHLSTPDDRPLALQVASAVRRLVREGIDGDILVFLPGAGDIRRAREACAQVASQANLSIAPLHGDLTPQEQDDAIRPGGRRKLILSTNVAESSITIESVAAVVDSGLARVASHASWSGLPRLRIEKVSKASARQRAGRAGRTREGRCLRLYSLADFEARPDYDTAEILRLDLAQLRLQVAACVHSATPKGAMAEVPWLEHPPEAHVQSAERLLLQLGALDPRGLMTDLGRSMLRFAVHPRIARVLVEGERRGVVEEACVAAAILAEGDLRASSGARFSDAAARDEPTEASDLSALVQRFFEAKESRFSAGSVRAAGLDPRSTRAVAQSSAQLMAKCARRGLPKPSDPDRELLKTLLSGYPDRVARRVRSGGRQVALASGGAAELSEASVVRDAQWLVTLDAEEAPQGSRSAIVVRLASAIEPEWLIELFPDSVVERRKVEWNSKAERVEAEESLAWGALVMHASTSATPTEDEAGPILAAAALKAGARAFAPEGALDRWLLRARYAASVDSSIPFPDDALVRNTLVDLCNGLKSFADLRSMDLLTALRAHLGRRSVDVERLAPDRVTLLGGRSVLVRYEEGKPPRIASRMQDFFGMAQGPRLGGAGAGGAGVLVLELLAPNGRAVQVTADLAGFWQKHYPGLRKELMRRYPKHAWPEDPRSAPNPRR